MKPQGIDVHKFGNQLFFIDKDGTVISKIIPFYNQIIGIRLIPVCACNLYIIHTIFELSRLIYIDTARSCLITIQHIITKNFKLLQILICTSFFPIRLMIGIDNSICNMNRIQHFGRKLIRIYIFFPYFQAYIIPYKILCLEHIASGKLLFCNSQIRKMISIYNQNRILSKLSQRIR